LSATLAFALKTAPDVAGLRRLTNLPARMSDHDVAEYAMQRRRASHGCDALAPHVQRIVAIAGVWQDGPHIRLMSLAVPALSEAQILQRFFDDIEHTRPQLASWQAQRVDLPVLHMRALIHGVAAPHYWAAGVAPVHLSEETVGAVERVAVIDLAATLAPAAHEPAPLAELAGLIGLPAHMLAAAPTPAAACEIEAVLTHVVMRRLAVLRGDIDPSALARELAVLRGLLRQAPGVHWQDFLAAWPE
jgi:3'-5' exonuclease